MADEKSIIEMLMAQLPMRIVSMPKPMGMNLHPEEKALADALIQITQKYGKFNQDYTGVWAGYDDPTKNEVASIGVKCSNCILYEGGSSCKIISLPVAPEGKCRFAVIPDGVVKPK
jgi:lipoate-protein ligase B